MSLYQRKKPQDDLVELVGSLKATGKYSDLKIICGDKTFNVHTAIICPQSEYFERAIGGQFMEAETRTINISDDDPKGIARMIDFFYTADYDDLGKADPAADANDGQRYKQALMVNTIMYALGDKYVLPKLKTLAQSKFEIYTCGYRVNTLLHETAGPQSGSLLDIIRTVYTTTPSNDRGLKNLLPLDKMNEVVSNASLEEIGNAVPEFQFDLLKVQLKCIERTLAHEREKRSAAETELVEVKRSLVGQKGRATRLKNELNDLQNHRLPSLRQEAASWEQKYEALKKEKERAEHAKTAVDEKYKEAMDEVTRVQKQNQELRIERQTIPVNFKG